MVALIRITNSDLFAGGPALAQPPMIAPIRVDVKPLGVGDYSRGWA